MGRINEKKLEVFQIFALPLVIMLFLIAAISAFSPQEETQVMGAAVSGGSTFLSPLVLVAAFAFTLLFLVVVMFNFVLDLDRI